MARIQLAGYRCERCGHEWVPRDAAREPRVCPNCKSPYWNIARGASGYESFKEAIERALRGSGRSMTWSQIREEAGLLQKFPNNKWVRRLEDDIGLVRKPAKNGTVHWRLR